MRKSSKNNKFITKNNRKIIRSIFQGIILAFFVYLIAKQFFVTKEYVPYNNEPISDNGFISISYFGVSTSGDETLIDSEVLDMHIRLLKERGYVTITQQDVLDYYNNGKKLPEKSLFLVFEDGRRDTAMFSQRILEKYNYKATMLSYAEKLIDDNTKYLTDEDLRLMEKSSFWEFGTNGYRLAFINVFDRYNNFIGELNISQYKEVLDYIDRDYNHYLMDYIRDERNIPKETYSEMQGRFKYDYVLMNRIYKDVLGQMPILYTIMHSNTGMFGTNDRASDVNKEYISELFEMNINREGNSYNTLENSKYDLTRMQPQPYWSANHLLMRIWDDTYQRMTFEIGDPEKAKSWEKIEGQVEFLDESIIITSKPHSKGTYRLKENLMPDINVKVDLNGNKLGCQTIYLRADKDLTEYVCIKLKNNNLIVNESSGGSEEELFTINLDEIDDFEYKSIAEDERDARIAELKVRIDEQQDKDVKEELEEDLKVLEAEEFDESTDYYVPRIQLKDKGSRNFDITLSDTKLDIKVDGESVVEGLNITTYSEGYLYLECEPELGYSQRNLVDDVYDGRFDNLVVENVYFGDEILYDNRQRGYKKIWAEVEDKTHIIVNWFMDNL